jgi:hypothetical protein
MLDGLFYTGERRKKNKRSCFSGKEAKNGHYSTTEGQSSVLTLDPQIFLTGNGMAQQDENEDLSAGSKNEPVPRADQADPPATSGIGIGAGTLREEDKGKQMNGTDPSIAESKESPAVRTVMVRVYASQRRKRRLPTKVFVNVLSSYLLFP